MTFQSVYKQVFFTTRPVRLKRITSQHRDVIKITAQNEPD